jgi:hypothetical protein
MSKENIGTKAGPVKGNAKSKLQIKNTLMKEAAKPWPTPVDGVELLDGIVATFNRHLYLPYGAAETLALWVLFTHTFDAWEISPRILFTSQKPGYGRGLAGR